MNISKHFSTQDLNYDEYLINNYMENNDGKNYII